MSGIMKGAAVLLLLIAAVLVAFALYLGMKPKPEVVQPLISTQNPEPAATLQAVVVVKRDVKAGETLQADALQLAQWPAAPAQSFNSLEELNGKTLRFDLEQGQPVLSSFIAKSLASYLDAGERAVTIPIDVITGASHRVEPGDLVDIFITFNSNNEVHDTQARLLMPRVRVLAYGGASLSGPDKEEANPSRADTQARHAMLAVPLESVNELLLASRSGSLQLVLRAPMDESLPDASLFPEFAGLIPARAGLDADQRDALKLPDNRAMAGLGLREFAISQTEKEQERARAVSSSGERHAAPPRRTEVIRGGRLELVEH